ncbi:hypothetical protein [Chryseobacterium sp. CH21]|uniref:hypothetical protein n=1 Tax=Chryseobacterium sp. CH21 TaxID=713556 RepID=UPI00100B78B5|nr:hypothetical protein [Chryseobacterium sp. CH21]
MRELILKHQKIIIIVASLLSITFASYSIYGKISLAFSPNQATWAELSTIIFDLPILLPGIIGLFYFFRNKSANILVPAAYLVLSLACILSIFLAITQVDALAFGLPMLLIVIPICILICILLIGLILFDYGKLK